jgi:hypothetical protein
VSAATARTTLSVQPTASPTFTGTLTAATCSFSGTVTVTSPLVVTGTVAGNVRQLRMQTSGSTRWEVGPGFDAESGSNVGSTFWVTRWSDSGVFLGTPISIARATGVVTFESQVLVAAGSVSACSVAPSGDPNTGLYFPSADVAAWVTNGTERVRIGSGGRVQFFAADEKFGVQLNKGATGNGPFIGSDGADIFTISTAGGAERVRVDASGNVGIGASPGTTLDIQRASADAAVFVQGQTSGTGATVQMYSGSGLGYVGTRNNYPLLITTNNSERMRVSSAGNVTIGEANSANTRLMVAGGSSNISSARATYEGTLQINESSLTTLASIGGIEFKASVFGSGYGVKILGADDGALIFGNRANSATWSESMRITQNREMLIGTTSDNGAYLLQVNSQIYATNATIATSDARFKTNVESLTDATSVIESLRPVAFDFIPQADRNFATERQVGLIAQETQAALAGTDYADSVVAQCGDHLGLAYEKLVPVLIKALQESNARIAALEERING